MNATILYYTSNRELAGLERLVKENISKVSNGLPIVSVSQKPIDFGKNICVGEVGASGFNMFRQVQIGLKKIKTKYVVSCEADCLYPPDYFTYEPKEENVCYRNNNLFVMGQWRKYFYFKKEGATHSQIVGRDFYLDTLNTLFEEAPEWSLTEFNFPKERWKKEDIFDKVEYFTTISPVVQIKSDKSMRHYTHSDRTPIYNLPYWGNGKDFRKKYYATN
jgi:hypothetical protein